MISSVKWEEEGVLLPLKASLKLNPSSPNRQTFNFPSAVILKRLHVPQNALSSHIKQRI